MDAKSKLQQKVLALKRGYTASDIKYFATQTKHDKWRADLRISHLKFMSTGLYYNKRSAETAAAENVLKTWRLVAKQLKRRPPKKEKRKIIRLGSDCEEEEEEEEEQWNFGERCSGTSGLSREDYIELGKLMERAFLIIQKKYS